MSILLQNLVQHYGPTRVVDNVSLEIQDGELFVLLGASGSGKSTVLRMIAGLMPVETGRIYLHGRDVTYLTPQQRNVGFVFQNYSLFRHMTVAENIEFGLDVRGTSKRERTARRDELLDLIGLTGLGGRYPRQLSGGQQQRVAVARALAFNPSVLLLDEPFGALDVKIRAQLRQSLKAIQRHTKVTTILVTHDQEEAFELAARIGVLDKGRLLEVAEPESLYRQPHHEFVAQFLGQATLLAGRYENGAVQVGTLTLPDTATAVPAQTDRVAVLLRPEDVAIAHHPEHLEGGVLGSALVESVQFLGTLQRMQLRLQPTPGIQVLSADYGTEGIPVQAALLTADKSDQQFKVGDSVWVGIRNYHLLARTGPQVLVAVEESADSDVLRNLQTLVTPLTDGPVTVVVASEHDPAPYLQLAQKALAITWPQATFKTHQGATVPALAAEANEGPYELVVIGAQSVRAQTVAEQLTRQSNKSVLVLKGERATLRRILLCTAGGEPGKMDVMVGARLARRLGATVTLFHVARDVPVPAPASPGAREVPTASNLPAQVTRHLTQGAQTLQNEGLRVETKVRTGVVLDEIMTEASEGNYDLIVVGGHLSSNSPRERDLAADVLRLADCPVLVVRGELT